MKPKKWFLGLTLLAAAQAQFKQQSKLVASGSTQQGYSVALSADGNTALVGAPDYPNAGAAFVFTRSGTVWTQQGGKLFGAGGDMNSRQGSSVALSADGNTALVAGTGDSVNHGAVWVFTRSGGVWNQQGNKLVGSSAVGTPDQGWSVALSADGNTALVGGPGDNNNVGAAWVFTRSGGVWNQQGGKLVGSGAIGTAHLGGSVALSADGNTALIGGPGDNPQLNSTDGAAWVFTRTGTTWTQQGTKLVGSGAIGHAGQGASVALSADGNTALMGGSTDNLSTGALWVFTRSAGMWTQQGSKLVGSGGSGLYRSEQGYSVALSGDGSLAITGAPLDNNGVGSVWVFRRSGGVWAQQGGKLEGSGATIFSHQGLSIALSATGSTAIVGAPDGVGTGATWIFALPHILDFDGDGRSDALLYDAATGTAYTALSNGDGTYQYVYNLFTPAFDILRTGDFDGDGKSDVILYNSHTALAYIGLSKGDGEFAFQSLFWSPGYDLVEGGDIDGDGKTDFALYNSSTGTLYTGISNGAGGFTYKYHLVSSGFTLVRLADFTGDGKADLFLYNGNNGLTFFGAGDGAGDFAFHPLFVSPFYSLADIGDLNGDGRTDIILYNATNGNAATGISDGAGGFAFTPLLFSPGFTSVRLADITGEGNAGVTLYNMNTATAYFGTGTGLGTFNFQMLFWGPGYDSVIAEDVTGDGKTDIMLYNSATGTEYTGISSGAGLTYTYQFWSPGKSLADTRR